MATKKTKTSLTPTIPSMMKAVAIDRFGPPSVLNVHALPVPALQATAPASVAISLEEEAK
jgi:hypothetical protein